MQKLRIWGIMFFILVFSASYNYNPVHIVYQSSVAGAWRMEEGSNEQLLIFSNNYFTYTSYDRSAKKFNVSQGGTYQIAGDQVDTHVEYNSDDKNKVGTSASLPYSIDSGNLIIEVEGKKATWQKVDDGSGPLAGAWQISGRMQDGKMSPIESGARKTIKILSGTRFQWVAMNTETKEFFGTGGGAYSFSNGKYTENIEFFSRDSSRVGVSLSFDGSIENNTWHHSGTSSTGEKIHEIWSKLKEE